MTGSVCSGAGVESIAWTIERVDWDDERAAVLRAAMDDEISPRYAEVFAAFDDETAALLAQDFAVDPETIVDVILVLDPSGEPVGHAALRALGDDLEVKRVFVDPRARGRGASRALMAELERLAVAHGAERLILQTGDRQPEAIALYERIGYRAIPVFPPYVRFVESRCFAKALTDEIRRPWSAAAALSTPVRAVARRSYGRGMTVTRLLLVRHGESEGNVAASRAERDGSPTIDLDVRDADVPLSATGEEQARALRTWWEGAGPIDEYWVSPYLRARQTLALAVDDAALSTRTRVDDRLRDRELGILDLLTTRGVREFHPEEAARRRHLGKYYHRPPGGESWADVALRLRSFLGENLDRPADTVMVVAHDAVVMLILAVLLPLDETELLSFAAENTVRNASVTELVRGEDAWQLTTFSSVEHLAVEGADITVHSGDDDGLEH